MQAIRKCIVEDQSVRLRGVVPVMVVPFEQDERIAEAPLRKEVDFAIESGAVGVCAPGFASEFYKLTDEERRLVIALVVDQTKKRVPVFAGTGCGSVRATIELSQFAESAGADGIMVAAPKWCSLGVREQMGFFEAVCHNVTIPVMLQDADFIGAGLPADVIIDLAERCPNLKFAKLENILAGTKCAEVVRLSGGEVQVLYGMAGIALMDGLAHGASGVMPGPALSDAFALMFALYDFGRLTHARDVFYSVLPYISFAIQHLELAIFMDKNALVRRGVFVTARMREPSFLLDAEYQAQMDELIVRTIKVCSAVKETFCEDGRLKIDSCGSA